MSKANAQTRPARRTRTSSMRTPWLMRSTAPVWAVVGMAVAAGSGMVAKEYAARMGVLTPLTAIDTAGNGLARDVETASSDAIPTEGLDFEASSTSVTPEAPTIGTTDSSLAVLAERAAPPASEPTPGPVAADVKIESDEPIAQAESYETNANLRWFNGRPIRPARSLTMVVTAYTPSENCCPGTADDLTASMHHVRTNAHRLVAADSRLLPLGSMITVPGYDDDQIVPVLDRGGAIKGHRLDVLFPSMREARAWGVRRLKVTVWAYADGKPGDNYRTMRDGH